MLRFLLLLCLAIIAVFSKSYAQSETDKFDEITLLSKRHEGFFNFYWMEKEGKIYLELSEFNKEFLYISFLSAGVGSNDIGLDRGKLGSTKLVKFQRFGPKVLLIQPNYDYRATSQNTNEVTAVKEAFAQSVLAGFNIEAEKNDVALIDITDFIIKDANNISNALKWTKQGNYKIDKSKSVVFPENTKNFPKNSEFEALITFTGNPEGKYVRQVVPTASNITVRQRHSFVELPDKNYQKRVFDPRAGFFGISYMDYATPIDEEIRKRFISRHRLEKTNPSQELSEPKEPIIYYVDPGTPEPVRSALIDGASWWNEAFEAAGFKNAFQVKLLPEGADPLDIRYNVIQWVHRSTRGWSYGASVVDPRTGEIIKGHVSLGSLRVRQDFLIAQGLLNPYEEGQEVPDEMVQMALARLRQLSAHEVGHTIGLAHNYVSSTYDRGSVMDYPHPLVTLKNGKIDLSQAYDVGIGDWDKLAIRYGYSQFEDRQNETDELNKIIQDGIKQDVIFLSDKDARPAGSAHPGAHLWDNGHNASSELDRIIEVRAVALGQFSENSIPMGTPMASAEEVLAPVYFMHRYQTEAAVKIVGGLEYNYAVRGDGTFSTKIIDPKLQKDALSAVLKTVDPEFLRLDDRIVSMIPPKPMGYSSGRESIKSYTSPTFDPIAAAETASKMTFDLLLHPSRLARIVQHHARYTLQPSLEDIFTKIDEKVNLNKVNDPLEQEIKFVVQNTFVDKLIQLSENKSVSAAVRAQSYHFLTKQFKPKGSAYIKSYLQGKIRKMVYSPDSFEAASPLSPPDGSPIGSTINELNIFEYNCSDFH